MKILRITAEGIPLFKHKVDISFTTQQRVSRDGKACLHELAKNCYLNTANAFIGINASGKTSILRLIDLAFSIINNEPINHAESRNILANSTSATLCIYFYDSRFYVGCLETVIKSVKTMSGNYIYTIVAEKMWEKPFTSVKSKKYLTDFTGYEATAVRDNKEVYLPDDVSMIIAHNRTLNDYAERRSLLSYTNINILPALSDIPSEIINFLDPTIQKLIFDVSEGKELIRLQFKDEAEIVMRDPAELEKYLSSGTIKGIITFLLVKDVLKSGAYLLIDELENHFNREIVVTLLRFFMDSQLNRAGATLIFTTHYPELLDEYERNDGIWIIRNRAGITVDNLSKLLQRNDIKKSDAYQSDFLAGTTPAYAAYIALKKFLANATLE